MDLKVGIHGRTTVGRAFETLDARLQIGDGVFAHAAVDLHRGKLDHRLCLGSSSFDLFVGSREFLAQAQDQLGDKLNVLPRPLGENFKMTTGIGVRGSVFLPHRIKEACQIVVGHRRNSTPLSIRESLQAALRPAPLNLFGGTLINLDGDDSKFLMLLPARKPIPLKDCMAVSLTTGFELRKSALVPVLADLCRIETEGFRKSEVSETGAKE